MNTVNPSPGEPIIYDGKLGEQYKIFIVNVFLGLITLGIYHFWGRTRQRRYTTSSFSIFNDRLEYTGYGGQLFWGLVKALAIILLFSLPLFYAVHTLDIINQEYAEKEKKEQSAEKPAKQQELKDKTSTKEIDPDKLSEADLKEYLESSGLVGFYAVFFYGFLPFVAVFGSLRYRVTHTRWRGIRGHMHGSTIIYGLVGLFHLFLSIITLGLWIPFSDAITYKYKMNRISFGNQQAVFKPDYGTLFGAHILSYMGGSFIGVILGIVMGSFFYGLFLNSPNPSDEIAITVGVFAGMFTFFFCLYIARFWYRASFVRMRYNYLTFGNIGFNCKISGWGLFKQTFGNNLILIFTIGLGYPIVIQRRMKFFCKHTNITGDINKSPILQAVGEKDTAGEGISSLLDVSIGLF